MSRHHPQQRGDPRDIVTGGLLSIVEAMTLGMPLEVWKTRQGAHPEESAVESLRALHRQGGWRAFFRGSTAKALEAGTKGAVLLYSKELLLDALCSPEERAHPAGWVGGLAGAGGGIAQTVVMAPLTYVVTYKLKNPDCAAMSSWEVLRRTGIRGAYSSSLPVALRQASNWALRQGFADGLTNLYRAQKGGKLNKAEQIACGLAGGAVACINQPFEILRIRVQAMQAQGKSASTLDVAKIIYQERGIRGFYAALIPRMCLSAYQTLFMVTFASMIREHLTRR